MQSAFEDLRPVYIELAMEQAPQKEKYEGLASTSARLLTAWEVLTTEFDDIKRYFWKI